MRSAIVRALFVATTLSVAACADLPVEPEGPTYSRSAVKADDVALDDDPAAPRWTYYLVDAVDYRRCVSPLCGGVYIKRVGQPKTKCADGTWAKTCYVFNFDWSSIGLDEDAANALTNDARDGHVLVRGTIETGHFDGFADVGVLVAEEAWKAASDVAPKGDFYAAHDNGIRCITYPCGSVTALRLNRNKNPLGDYGNVDLSRVSDDAAVLEALGQDLFDGELVVAATIATLSGPAGKMDELRAYQAYRRVEAAPVAQACGSRGLSPCPEGYFCNFSDAMCGAADRPGQCEVQPDVCTKEYFPVCGCDGQTYGNDCMRRSAGVGFGTIGACDAPAEPFLGNGCKLGGCSSEICLNDDAEDRVSICIYRPEYECYANHGRCEVQADGACGWSRTDALSACLAEDHTF